MIILFFSCIGGMAHYKDAYGIAEVKLGFIQRKFTLIDFNFKDH